MITSILLAEPHEGTRSLYHEVFQPIGWECRDATDGRDALVQALTAPPTLLLTELRLPFIDGFDLCRQLRSDAATARLPVLVVTSDASHDAHVRAMRAGATAVFVKPAAMDAVVLTVTQLIEESRELRRETESLRMALRRQRASSTTLRHQSEKIVQRARKDSFDRYWTTAPGGELLELSCPTCLAPMTYEGSFFGGVNDQNVERWDVVQCGRCDTRFEYRFRTRRLRPIA